MKDKLARSRIAFLSEKLDALAEQNRRLLNGLEAVKNYIGAVEMQIDVVAKFVGLNVEGSNGARTDSAVEASDVVDMAPNSAESDGIESEAESDLGGQKP